MCYLISVAVARSGVDVKSHFRAHDLRAVESKNPTVCEALGATHVYDITDHELCSCSLHAFEKSGAGEIDLKALRLRYAKKGWAAAKIERATKSASRPRFPSTVRARARFFAALEVLCEMGAEIRMLSHDYTERFDEERFKLNSPKRVSLQALSQQPIKDDSVLTIHS